MVTVALNTDADDESAMLTHKLVLGRLSVLLTLGSGILTTTAIPPVCIRY